MISSATHPKHILKFCPKCGGQPFEYDNIKSFDCKVCGFKFYINEAAATAAILVDPSGKIVLAKRKNEPRAGFYDFPGGFVDVGERAEDCLRREVMEELSLQITDIEFLASFPNEYLFRGISYYTCDLAFICKVSDFETIKPNDDVAEALIIMPTEVDFSILSFPSVENILRKYLEKISI